MTDFEKPSTGEAVEPIEAVEKPLPQPEKKVTQRELQERLRDPNFLPTREFITVAFENQDQAWDDFCYDKEKPVYEVLNEEYLNALADYFVSKIKEYGANKEKPLVILEIGAGNGRLTHFLQEKLEERVPGQTKVIATDSGEWKLKADFPVEPIKHIDSLKKYSPDIVLFSWMPYREDYTKEMRKTESVKEYILIGPAGGGPCGAEWDTWGYTWLEDEGGVAKAPPYEEDGFEKEYLDDLRKLQICRTDDPGNYFHSDTVRFKRK